MKKMFTNFNNQTRALEETINEFVDTKRGKKAGETVKYYTDRLNEFYVYLKEHEQINDIQDITRAVIDRYMNHKKTENPQISNQTLNNNLRAIRTFVNYCIGEGYIRHFKIEMFPSTNIPKPSYTQEEQERLIKKPDLSKCGFTEYRNWVIVCHFLASGNRSKTVRHIKIKHVDLEKRRIILDTTKNNEILYMPISDTYYPILRDYMKARKGQPDDYLFCSQYGKQLTAGGLRCIMRKYNLSQGVSTTSLHRYRNTFAETWIMNDGNPKKLQYALGHKTQHMVDEYVSIYGKELKEEYNDYTPLSKQKEKLETKKKMRIQDKCR
jgi:integrase/recombinase XerD